MDSSSQKLDHTAREISFSERPRIFFALGLGPKKVGALEKFLRHFAVAMDARNWDTVFCFDGTISDEFRAYVDLPFVKIESLNGQANLGFACSTRLWSLLRQYKPSVFIYAFHSVIRTFPWIARMAGVKTIFFNDRSSRAAGHYPVKSMAIAKRMAAKALTAPVSSTITVSNFVKRAAEATDLSTAPVIAILNGVEADCPHPERGTQFRERFGIPKEALLICMACWVVAVKGVEILLEAAAPLIFATPSLWVTIVGEGAQLPEYRALAEQLGIAHRVVFTGLMIDPTREGAFDACDIYCQPSLWQEAFSFAIAEAMAVAVPVVASRIGGIPEIVQDRVTGLLFPAADVCVLRDCLTRLVEDPGLRRQFGQAGHARILANHQVEAMADKYAEVILAQWTSTQ